MTSTIAAIRMPTISPEPCSGAVMRASPPISTVSPAALAAVPESLSASRVSSFSSMPLTVYFTLMYAVEPSWLTACIWKGSATEATWALPAPSLMPETIFSTWSLLAWSVILAPCGALMTMRAEAPSADIPGNFSSSTSKAFWASVPGIENEPEVGAPADAAPKPAAKSSATHMRATRPRRRKAPLPSL